MQYSYKQIFTKMIQFVIFLIIIDLGCYSVTQSCLPICTPWTAACQAYLSFTISRSLLKLMSIESVIHPTILSSVIPFASCFQSFPESRSFLMSWFFTSYGQSIGASVSNILLMNIQDWVRLGLTGLISLQSLGGTFLILSLDIRWGRLETFITSTMFIC